jgi:hypothetical protein
LSRIAQTDAGTARGGPARGAADERGKLVERGLAVRFRAAVTGSTPIVVADGAHRSEVKLNPIHR